MPANPSQAQSERPESWRAAAILHAIGVAVLAYFWFRDPAHGGFPRCQWHAWTGLQCPGCGGQRALHALLRGDLWQALGHNAFAVLVAGPALALIYAVWMGGLLGMDTSRWRFRAGLGWALLAAAVLFTIARNWPGGVGEAG